MSFGGRYNLPPFYREFEDVYRQLYEIYGICNYYGWGGALPPVALILNRSTRPTHVAGYAQLHATTVNGQVFNAISITLNICARAQTASFMPILLHEMTHIWQYAQGRRGGHGKDAGLCRRPCRTVARMHDEPASFVKGNGLRLLQDDGGVGSVNYGFLPATATNPLRGDENGDIFGKNYVGLV